MNMPRHTEPFEVCSGMEIYLQPTGNASRNWDGVAKKGEVVSVKRKYFYVVIRGVNYCSPEIKFSLQDFTSEDTDLNSGWLAYPSLTAFREAREWKRQLMLLRGAWHSYGVSDRLSAGAVKKIYEIMVAEGAISEEG